MTLDQIRKQVLANLDDRSGRRWANVENDRRLDRLIEDAHRALAIIAERVDPKVFVQTVKVTTSGIGIDAIGAGFPEEALPSDFRRLVAIIRTDVSPSRPVQVINADRAGHYASINVSDVVYLRRTANATPRTVLGFPAGYGGSSSTETYAVHYIARVPSLLPNDGSVGDGTAVPAIPVEYHRLISLGATIRALLQEHSDPGGFNKIYKRGVKLLTAALPRREGVLLGI